MTNKPSPSPLDRQLALEAQMRSNGIDRYLKDYYDASIGGTFSTSNPGNVLLKRMVAPVTAEIDRVGKRTTGRWATVWQPALDLVPAEVLAAIGCRVTVDGITQVAKKSSVAYQIGRMVDDECRAAALERKHPGYYKRLMYRLDKAPNAEYRARVLRDAWSTDLGEDWKPFDATERSYLGVAILEIIQATTGTIWFDERQEGRRKRITYLQATPETLRWITSFRDRNAELSPVLTPMVVPPRPWTDVDAGGYYTLVSKIMKTRDTTYLNETLRSADLTKVYLAINTLQETPWRINRWLLEVADALAEAGDERVFPFRGGLNQSIEDSCPLPFRADELTEEEHIKWRRDAVAVYTERSRQATLRVQWARISQLCQQYRDEPEIYFPYQLDFRGRVYPMPMFLNPQGADWSRGFLEFAQGEPLGDRGWYWLAVHVANTYGFDKASFDDRVAWVMENEAEILKAGEVPLESQWWRGADKPWQHLAACRAWYDHRTLGDQFVCHLPVAMDGSCNGLQHLSAVLRDSVGGSYVNLMPSDTPKDIYARVAEATTELVKGVPRVTDRSIEQITGILATVGDDGWGDPEKALADQMYAMGWLEIGIDRSMTKRPTMILPYGGTPFGIGDYIHESLSAHIKFTGTCPWDQTNHAELRRASRWNAVKMWAAMCDIVVAARKVMDWLRGVAMATKGPLEWVTPIGLPVRQAYYKADAKQIRVRILGNLVAINTFDKTPKINTRKMSNSISPNWIHSMDASALMLTVVNGLEEGLKHWSMIHDSYAVLPSQVQTMQRVLRATFVEMYETHDVLAEFEEFTREVYPDVELPVRPPKGDLDLRKVKRSKYFFG